ncbi:MAG: ribonuclease Y [Deltaproteobacteria bacterium CG11_big_fil_rev_8_21_14_0_20_47_16]|nr:MAG: ribonuclease Y [Deltaproteobacteria bacterium CG11_big_fil_rev_8_21_14_0_20_47_16]
MDMSVIVSIGAAVVGIVGGFFFAVMIFRKGGSQRLQAARVQAESLLKEAESNARSLRKEAELEVRDKELKARAELEKTIQTKMREFQETENRLMTREEALEKKFDQIEKRESEQHREVQALEARKKQLEQIEAQHQQALQEARKTLEQAAGLTQEEAKKKLIDSLIDDAKMDSANQVKIIVDEAKEKAEAEARKIISISVERMASDHVAERSISSVHLPNEEMKGRIIGREGRNIRALEAATGIDIVVDETPEAVVLSGFNPIRREVARRTLEHLIQDGRIHPARIEEIVAKMEKEVEGTIKEAGEQAIMELGLGTMHPDLVKHVGMLKYRFSYAQNVLRHSIDVGFLCGLMAGELGMDVKKARRAGLLHDVGKSVSHEVEGSHALIGMEMARKCKEDPEVCHAIGAHHEDIPQESALDALVDAADALSGARPGARREVLEAYMKRLEDLENISTSFKGVDKAYAIQAGREIRVIVNHQKITDAQAVVLSRDIAKKIQNEMTYPGQIKVTVVRETRAVEYAK